MESDEVVMEDGGVKRSSEMEYVGVVVSDMAVQLEAIRSRLRICAEKLYASTVSPHIDAQATACDTALVGVMALLKGLEETVRLELDWLID